MPELPEVQTVVNTLRPHVVGVTIAEVSLARADILEPVGTPLEKLLAGRTIFALDRRAKRIIFTLDDGNRFYIHLGMTGRLTLDAASAPLRKHTHLTVRFTSLSSEMRFVDPRRFGGIHWQGQNHAEDDLGPEPLTLRVSQLAPRLAAKRRPIKSALLDQSVIAGLGNIYVDEALFAAGIHPLTLATDLTPPRVKALNRAIKQVLRRAIHHRGSTLRDYRDANGEAGNFQSLHRVYGREGEPCLKCKIPIVRIVITGRSSHFCPKCQLAMKRKRASSRR